MSDKPQNNKCDIHFGASNCLSYPELALHCISFHISTLLVPAILRKDNNASSELEPQMMNHVHLKRDLTRMGSPAHSKFTPWHQYLQ